MTRLGLAGLVSCACLLAGSAAAQPARVSSVEGQYADAIRNALVEMSGGNYAEARALFMKAHTLLPSARTERGLGTVEFELRNYSVSVMHFRAALASAVRPLDEAMRAEVAKALLRAESYTGTLQLTLDPPGGTLKLDGQRIALPADGTLRIDLGIHDLQYQLPGRRSVLERIEVHGGEHSELRIALGEPGPAGAVAGDDRRSRSDGGLLSRWWFWTAAGVVVVGAAVGIAVAASSDPGTQAPIAGNLGTTQSVLTVAR
jgi:hypothetical protein